jgi:hypothetical protein
MIASTGPEAAPAWSTALFSLLHPAQIAMVEAFEWIEEPMSATILYQVLGRTFVLGTIAYHVRRLADAGVLTLRYSEPRGGTREHFYGLAT